MDGTLRYFFNLIIFLALLLCGEAEAAIPSLLECLQTLTPDAERGTRQADLWEVHQGWIQTMMAFVQEQAASHTVCYPSESDHPFYHFDRRDAQIILRPILRNIARLDLTDEAIERIFFETSPIYKDDGKSSPIEYFLAEDVKKESFKIAEKTYGHVQGHVLLLLGQTPAYVGEMVKSIDHILSGRTHIINVPFSGRPDYLRKVSYKNLWPSAFLDIVTPEGEAFFRSMLEHQQFNPKSICDHQKKLFILDNSSGSSVACFLAFLKKWCEEVETPFPDVIFLEMCDADDLGGFNEQGQWVSSKKPNLRFDGSLEFDIPVIFLGMKDDILYQFDMLYENLRIVPSFNGLHWSKPYFREDWQKDYPSTEAQKIIREYHAYAINSLFSN